MTNKLQAGTAIIDVSPGPGIELAGYPHHPRPNQGVHDPLYASCITLNDGTTRLAMVCMDIIYYPKNAVNDLREEVASATEIPAANIMVCCSHTHSGPSTKINSTLDTLGAGWNADEDYLKELHHKLVKLVSDA